MGLELLARAGYDPEAAPAIWERLALEHPWLIAPTQDRAVDHTWVGERLGAMRTQVERLKAKQVDDKESLAGPAVGLPALSSRSHERL